MHRGKKYIESAKQIEKLRLYDPSEALDSVVKLAKAKFDETVEVHIKLGVTPVTQISRFAVPSSFQTAPVKLSASLSLQRTTVQLPPVRRALSTSAIRILSSVFRRKTGLILTSSSLLRI